MEKYEVGDWGYYYQDPKPLFSPLHYRTFLAAATAKLLQSCPTLCDPTDGKPTRLPRSWDSLGKNTGVGCHFLLQRTRVKSQSEVAQLCPPLSDLMDCSLPGSSVVRGKKQRRENWRKKGCSLWLIVFRVMLFSFFFPKKFNGTVTAIGKAVNNGMWDQGLFSSSSGNGKIRSSEPGDPGFESRFSKSLVLLYSVVR